VDIESGIPDAEVREMIDHSYELVTQSLSKAERKKLEN